MKFPYFITTIYNIGDGTPYYWHVGRNLKRNDMFWQITTHNICRVVFRLGEIIIGYQYL